MKILYVTLFLSLFSNAYCSHYRQKFSPEDDQMLAKEVVIYLSDKNNDINERLQLQDTNDDKFDWVKFVKENNFSYFLLQPINWNYIAPKLKDRNTRQCRERWKHYLMSNKEEKWSEAEDYILMEKIDLFGKKWTKISSFLPGRTDINVKNRYYTLLNSKNQPSNPQEEFHQKEDSSNNNNFFELSDELSNIFFRSRSSDNLDDYFM